MINASDVIKYDRTDAELEEFLLFCVAVAGKTANQIAYALEMFLSFEKEGTPFQKIRNMIQNNTLLNNIMASRLGQHSKLFKAFSSLATSGIDLKTCTLEDLEKFHGIGPKTARYFMLDTRPNQKIAALDTHILKYIKENIEDKEINIPKATPSGKKYKILEAWFVDHCNKLGKDVAVFDLEIWNRYARR